MSRLLKYSGIAKSMQQHLNRAGYRGYEDIRQRPGLASSNACGPRESPCDKMDLLLSGGGHVGSGMYLPSSAPPPVQPSVPELVKPSRQGPSAEYTLGPGDVLRITIYGHGDLPQEVVISA